VEQVRESGDRDVSGHLPLEKVTAFVTRGPADNRELLVFRHPSGGVQLPAGTVEEGEFVEGAALREAREETGLTAVEVVSFFGTQPQPMRADARVVLRRVCLLQRPTPDSPEIVRPFPTYLGLRRGLYIRQIGEAPGGYAQVVYEEFDGPAHTAIAPSRSASGWIEADAITPTVVRHFFHLTPTEPTPDAWVQSAEEWGLRFELYWVPLLPPQAAIAGLIPSQAVWLAEYADRLAR
jgi:8-oxo-dGTP pyrophosphatase MutT (NUDIX family)